MSECVCDRVGLCVPQWSSEDNSRVSSLLPLLRGFQKGNSGPQAFAPRTFTRDQPSHWPNLLLMPARSAVKVEAAFLSGAAVSSLAGLIKPATGLPLCCVQFQARLPSFAACFRLP